MSKEYDGSAEKIRSYVIWPAPVLSEDVTKGLRTALYKMTELLPRNLNLLRIYPEKRIIYNTK